jgi:hypothetical protein
MQRLFFITLLFPALLLCSCSTAKSVLSSTNVKSSSFLQHGGELREDRKRSPFLGNWWTTDAKLHTAFDSMKQIYIAPIKIDAVRPMKNYLSRLEFSNDRRDTKLQALSDYARSRFIKAFRESKKPRFTVVDAPAKDALTLELHILEWEPNSFSGFIAREAVDLLTLPAVGDLISKPLRGVIAIEGRLMEPRSAKPIFEFVDKEEAKSLIIIPLQEAYPTGQARYAIREWAEQFELLSRNDPLDKPKDSFPIQLWGF